LTKPARRLTFRRLVTDPTREGGLGYCCPAMIFYITRNTRTIADRLGLSDRAIRYQKDAFEAGELKCECSALCLRTKVA
jgi:hypothetical protein